VRYFAFLVSPEDGIEEGLGVTLVSVFRRHVRICVAASVEILEMQWEKWFAGLLDTLQVVSFVFSH